MKSFTSSFLYVRPWLYADQAQYMAFRQWVKIYAFPSEKLKRSIVNVRWFDKYCAVMPRLSFPHQMHHTTQTSNWCDFVNCRSVFSMNCIRSNRLYDATRLTHWSRDKMAAIFQTTFSDVFSWMKMNDILLTFHYIQCSAVITRSIFSQILTRDTPQLAREGEIWSVFCEFEVWFAFRASQCSDVWNSILCWTAL